MTQQAAPADAITLLVVDSEEEVRGAGVDHVVDFTVIQLNDVYEAAPVEGGRYGGLARVATLRKQLEAENPNLLMVMVGDFLAPSVISATTGDAGQHMIEALNAAGLTHAAVGNHEFDLTEDDFLLRVEESRFRWVVSNVKNAAGQPYANVHEHDVVKFTNASGEAVRVALLGVCIDMVKKPWVQYQDPIETARAKVNALANQADVFLALTHLTLDHDKQLGIEVPRLDVLLGGHEHEAAKAIVGADATPIYKADSNARSAFVHHFRFDTQTRVTKLFSRLVHIDASFADEPETAAAVDRWVNITLDTLRAQGYDPDEVVGYAPEPLIGYEADVRSRVTNLTKLIIETFLAEVPQADVAILPSGLVRIDGIIPEGDITYFDVVRIFPIGGRLSFLNMPGPMLRTLLQVGDGAAGTGAHQLRANIDPDGNGGWWIKGEPFDENRTYKVVFSEVPASAFAYAPFKGTGTTKIYDTREMRAVLADRLRQDLRKDRA
ncbi:bifunctional metallophosphatase/5'-nucleotidase [Chondromyces crocatus]|uniref:5'-nucleotidase n=1 Tax=Chondromyces crocatus TaxID=52 RepID=Q0VZ66_CHOCO|nr:bifunctional metallophosphatase/5'-nucleotidase [Chondromyces crocatus]AKT40591.1 5'-nucleotidase [Chondromyces crocatus]CAJ46696.1 putative nucleotidase-2',3'-cyclic phosphodiesterase [Chondromyces crocatus]